MFLMLLLKSWRNTMLIKIICLFLINGATGTISGLNYMEPLIQRPHTNYLPGEDLCNPLYWYPRQVPEYCYYKIPPKPKVRPVSVPIPVPMPMPPPPMPQPPPPMFPAPMMPMIPQQFAPPPIPLPYGLPLAPSGPIIPVPGVLGMPRYYPPHQNYATFAQMAGMMPGIAGLVTKDGGINVLPFSDAYADLIDKHKNKMVRKKLKKLMNDYDRRFRY